MKKNPPEQKYAIEFKSFLEKELTPALEELAKFEDEKSRKHIQKLVFTNLVDRLDFCIDNTLLVILETNDTLIDRLLVKHREPISEANILKLFLSESPKEIAVSRLKETLTSTLLRKRHSEKLRELLTLTNNNMAELKSPRVNPSSGRILKSFKVQNKKIPPSVLGYSDWLYSRRNAVVHGGGNSNYLENDLVQLKKLYNVVPAKTFKLSLSSIKVTGLFYADLVEKFFL